MVKVRLNQIVALNAPKKAEFQKFLGDYYKQFQKVEPFFGLEKTYEPLDSEGEQLPPESAKVQLKVSDILDNVKQPWVDMFDVVLTNDKGNCVACANITVDDVIIARDVPISTLLFLEKRLEDWKNVIDKIPVLPLSDSWNFNNSSGLYETEEKKTSRSKKIEKPLIIVPPTDKHPAQAKTVEEVIPVGVWTQRKLSSALPITYVEKLKKNLAKLREAVIKAREEANSIQIDQQKAGSEVLNYLFTV